MNKSERIEELVKCAQKLSEQGCENLVCVAKGMQIAAELSAQQKPA